MKKMYAYIVLGLFTGLGMHDGYAACNREHGRQCERQVITAVVGPGHYSYRINNNRDVEIYHDTTQTIEGIIALPHSATARALAITPDKNKVYVATRHRLYVVDTFNSTIRKIQ